jgi:isopentenyl-diphosphate delta-isomerase
VSRVSDIGERKEDHLELCATGDVGFHRTRTLLDDVRLIHDPLPDLALEEIDTGCTVLGKRLRAPLLISAMTGGTPRGGRINQDLASVAEELGIGFALGSQRPMLEDGSLAWTYSVREQASTTLVVGNLGLWQARRLGADEVGRLAARVGADAVAIHLNPAQELVQPGGDRDFRDGRRALAELAAGSAVPLVVKETGCGMGAGTARVVREAGIANLDVAGAGGTSWVAVETARARGGERGLGELLREWGVPTAAAVALAAPLGFDTLIASGGIETALDAARAIALGASAVGLARPVLRAYWTGGVPGVRRLLAGLIDSLRAVLLLTGSKDLASLRRAPRVVTGELAQWIDQSPRL